MEQLERMDRWTKGGDRKTTIYPSSFKNAIMLAKDKHRTWQQMKKSRIAEALEWMRDPMKVRGIATDRDMLQIQRKLKVEGHRAAKIVSRAELALRWTYIRGKRQEN